MESKFSTTFAHSFLSGNMRLINEVTYFCLSAVVSLTSISSYTTRQPSTIKAVDKPRVLGLTSETLMGVTDVIVFMSVARALRLCRHHQ